VIMNTLTDMSMRLAIINAAGQQSRIIYRYHTIPVEVITGIGFNIIAQQLVYIAAGVLNFLNAILVKIAAQYRAPTITGTIRLCRSVRRTGAIHKLRTIIVDGHLQLTACPAEHDTNLCPIVEGIRFDLSKGIRRIGPIDSRYKNIPAIRNIRNINPLAGQS